MDGIAGWFTGHSPKMTRDNISRNVKEISYSFFEKYGQSPYSELQHWETGKVFDDKYYAGFEVMGNTPNGIIAKPWTATGKRVLPNGQAAGDETSMSDFVIPNIANKPLKEGTSFIDLDQMKGRHKEIYQRNMANITAALRSHRLDNGDSVGGDRVGDNSQSAFITIKNLRSFQSKSIDPKSGLPVGESRQMTVADAVSLLQGMSYTSEILGE